MTAGICQLLRSSVCSGCGNMRQGALSQEVDLEAGFLDIATNALQCARTEHGHGCEE